MTRIVFRRDAPAKSDFISHFPILTMAKIEMRFTVDSNEHRGCQARSFANCGSRFAFASERTCDKCRQSELGGPLWQCQ